MRKLTFIVLHCSATNPSQNIGAKEIRQWHKARKWSDIGYHYVIRLSGKVELGRALEKVGAHVLGWNDNSVGICYVGGTENGKAKDTINDKQQAAFRKIVQTLRAQYGPLEVYGHNDFTNAKACPSFKVADKFSDLKLNKSNALPSLTDF